MLSTLGLDVKVDDYYKKLLSESKEEISASPLKLDFSGYFVKLNQLLQIVQAKILSHFQLPTMLFPTRSFRNDLLVRLLIFLVAGFFIHANNLLGEDWTSEYFHRSKEASQLVQYQHRYVGATRRLVNLNGEWQVRKVDEDAWHAAWVPGAYSFQGDVEYKRTFQIDSSFVGKHLQLIIWGINNRCQIFLNGEFLQSHSGGRTSFAVDISENRIHHDSPNEIRIIIQNKLLSKSSVPLSFPPRFSRNYGGIFRDIFVLATPVRYVRDLKISQQFDTNFTNCRLRIKSILANFYDDIEGAGSKTFTIQSEVWDIRKNERIAVTKKRPVLFEKRFLTLVDSLSIQGVDLWSPDHPNLYEMRTILSDSKGILDRLHRRVGFKDLTFEKSVLLNGKKLQIKGFDWIDDFPGIGTTAGWKTLKAEIQAIKSTGANAIRIMEGAPHPYFLDLCDDAGLLVFEQAPLFMLPDTRLRDLSFDELLENTYNEMLERDSWHTSFAALGIGTDLQLDSPYTRDFFARFEKKVAGQQIALFVASRFMPPAPLPDFIEFNFVELPGKMPEAILTFIKNYQTYFEETPVILSVGQPVRSKEIESDTGQPQNIRRGQFKKYSKSVKVEELQAYTLNRILTDVNQTGRAAGSMIFSFADWQSGRPNLVFGGDQDDFLIKTGIVNRHREKRIAFNVVKNLFKAYQPIRMSVKVPVRKNPNIYPVAGIFLILVFLFHFNRNRKFRGNLNRIFVYPHGFYIELRENRKVQGMHTLLLSFVICTALGIVLSSIIYHFRQDLLFDELLNLFFQSRNIKKYVIGMLLQPFTSILVLTFLCYLWFTGIVVTSIFVSRILGQSVRWSQFFTLAFWSGANFVLLLPLVPIYYRTLNYPNLTIPVIAILFGFVIWFAIRLFRSLHIMYMLTMVRTIILGITMFVVVFGSVAWYFEEKYAALDYLKIYFKIIRSFIS